MCANWAYTCPEFALVHLYGHLTKNQTLSELTLMGNMAPMSPARYSPTY